MCRALGRSQGLGGPYLGSAGRQAGVPCLGQQSLRAGERQTVVVKGPASPGRPAAPGGQGQYLGPVSPQPRVAHHGEHSLAATPGQELSCILWAMFQ